MIMSFPEQEPSCAARSVNKETIRYFGAFQKTYTVRASSQGFKSRFYIGFGDKKSVAEFYITCNGTSKCRWTGRFKYGIPNGRNKFTIYFLSTIGI